MSNGRKKDDVPVAQAMPMSAYQAQPLNGSPYQQQQGFQQQGSPYQQQQQGFQQQGNPYQQQQVGYNYMNQPMNNMQQGFYQQNQNAQPEMDKQLLQPKNGVLNAAPQYPKSVGGFSVMDEIEVVAIKQRRNLLEGLADSAGVGCIEFQNKYDIYDATNGFTLMYAEEKSGLLMRACCKPNHTLELHVLDTRPGVPMNTSAMVIKRPFRCGGCPALHWSCQQTATAVLPSGEEFATSKVPFGGGGFTPTLQIMGRGGMNDQIGKVSGPTFIVGGLLAEMTGDLHFNIYPPGTTNTGAASPLARISKKKPQGFGNALTEAVGDSDMYVVEFAPGLESQKKLSLMSTALLLDYMFFENGAPFTCNPITQECECNLCTFYCFGCICPFTLRCGGNNNSAAE